MIEKPAFTLVGYRKRFTGSPEGEERLEQEHVFACETRSNQYLLHGMARDCDTTWLVLKSFDGGDYDLYIAAQVEDWPGCSGELGADAARFEVISILRQLYAVCETEQSQYPTNLTVDLRRRLVSECLPSSGCRLADAPELAVIHWPYERGNDALNASRTVELWLPVEPAE